MKKPDHRLSIRLNLLLRKGNKLRPLKWIPESVMVYVDDTLMSLDHDMQLDDMSIKIVSKDLYKPKIIKLDIQLSENKKHRP